MVESGFAHKALAHFEFFRENQVALSFKVGDVLYKFLRVVETAEAATARVFSVAVIVIEILLTNSFMTSKNIVDDIFWKFDFFSLSIN